jgi:hypothetical protein
MRKFTKTYLRKMKGGMLAERKEKRRMDGVGW